jgi:hypothetical protein
MRKYTNPFLPTPAQKVQRESVKDYKIWFHMLDYGEPVGDGFHSILIMAKAIQPVIQNKTEATTLTEGIRVMAEATGYNCWRKSYTKPVNAAMDVILLRFPNMSPKQALKAIQAAVAV